MLTMLTLVGALGLAAPLAAPAMTPTAVVRTTAAAPSTTAAPQDPVVNYESRETQATNLETFSGGKDDVVYVSAGVVLLVVLLLVLI